MSELLHDVGANESACNGTAVLHEIIINHANEIQEKDLKDKTKISNETDDSKTKFSVHHSKNCFEKFKVYFWKNASIFKVINIFGYLSPWHRNGLIWLLTRL